MCRSTFYVQKPCVSLASTLPACRLQLVRAGPTDSPKSACLSMPRLASGVVSPGAETLGFPSPSRRLPGFSALAVPRSVARPGSSVLRLHLPFGDLPTYSRPLPPAAPTAPSAALVQARWRLSSRPKRPVEPCAPRKVLRPLRRHAASPVHTGLATPCHLPPSAFPRPSAAYSSLRFVALFHATCARGVPSPSRLSPPRGAVPPLDGPCPHDVVRPSSLHRLRRNACGRARPTGPAFRALLPPRSPLLQPAV